MDVADFDPENRILHVLILSLMTVASFLFFGDTTVVRDAKYRKRAVEVYDKICQLEGKATHADRVYKREFIYAGVGPIPVQRAMERFYNATRIFPDFQDVYKLVKKVNDEEHLGMTPAQAHLTAQQVFSDFGKKLQRRRQMDDLIITRTYLPLQAEDPAEFDDSLRNKLERNRIQGRKEDDVLMEFVMKQTEAKESEEDKKTDRESEKASSRASDSENSDDEGQPKSLFMDSDEEIAYLEDVEKPREPSTSETSKRRATSPADEDEPRPKTLILEGPGETPIAENQGKESKIPSKEVFVNQLNLAVKPKS